MGSAGPWPMPSPPWPRPPLPRAPAAVRASSPGSRGRPHAHRPSATIARPGRSFALQETPGRPLKRSVTRVGVSRTRRETRRLAGVRADGSWPLAPRARTPAHGLPKGCGPRTAVARISGVALAGLKRPRVSGGMIEEKRLAADATRPALATSSKTRAPGSSLARVPPTISDNPERPHRWLTKGIRPENARVPTTGGVDGMTTP